MLFCEMCTLSEVLNYLELKFLQACLQQQRRNMQSMWEKWRFIHKTLRQRFGLINIHRLAETNSHRDDADVSQQHRPVEILIGSPKTEPSFTESKIA